MVWVLAWHTRNAGRLKCHCFADPHAGTPEVRIPVFVLVIASVVTIIELSMSAWFYDLIQMLGIFIPLIVTNCSIIGRAEAFASKNSVGRSFVDGVSMGRGFLLVLVTLGGLREIIGQGTLFAQAHLMFGEAARAMTITFIDDLQRLSDLRYCHRAHLSVLDY